MTSLRAANSPALISRPYRIGERLVQFTFDNGSLVSRWTPAPPDEPDEAQRRLYMVARNAFLDDVARQTGERIAVVER